MGSSDYELENEQKLHNFFGVGQNEPEHLTFERFEILINQILIENMGIEKKRLQYIIGQKGLFILQNYGRNIQ